MDKNMMIQRLNELESEFVFRKRNLKKLQASLIENEGELTKHQTVLAKEQKDVDNLDKVRIDNIFNKLVGRMDAVVEKEELELLQAKVKYDELEKAATYLRKEEAETNTKIEQLAVEIAKLREEGGHLYAEIKNRNQALQNEIVRIQSELFEIHQAIDAGFNVLKELDEAFSELKSANGWATWDTFGGGLFTDIMKYSGIDKAQKAMHELGIAIQKFQTELKDVSSDISVHYQGIDFGTKMFDVVFDNIFTDWHVKSKIKDNLRNLKQLEASVNNILASLRARKEQLQASLSEIEI